MALESLKELASDEIRHHVGIDQLEFQRISEEGDVSRIDRGDSMEESADLFADLRNPFRLSLRKVSGSLKPIGDRLMPVLVPNDHLDLIDGAFATPVHSLHSFPKSPGEESLGDQHGSVLVPHLKSHGLSRNLRTVDADPFHEKSFDLDGLQSGRSKPKPRDELLLNHLGEGTVHHLTLSDFGCDQIPRQPQGCPFIVQVDDLVAAGFEISENFVDRSR
ncbi:MAG: hypothetical protein JNJ70_09760 [Verrucomicrobiales bacterium]|nr:hypothetical protein [Verrucomicrobiales bacterium]